MKKGVENTIEADPIVEEDQDPEALKDDTGIEEEGVVELHLVQGVEVEAIGEAIEDIEEDHQVQEVININ